MGIIYASEDGVFLDSNPTLARLLGYISLQELAVAAHAVGAAIFINPEERPGVMRSLEGSEGWVRSQEVALRRKDGKVANVGITIHKVFGFDGRVAYLESFMEDLTERKRAEQALIAKEESYRYLFLNAPSAIYEMDFNGPRFKSVNDAMCRTSDYAREELLA